MSCTSCHGKGQSMSRDPWTQVRMQRLRENPWPLAGFCDARVSPDAETARALIHNCPTYIAAGWMCHVSAHLSEAPGTTEAFIALLRLTSDRQQCVWGGGKTPPPTSIYRNRSPGCRDGLNPTAGLESPVRRCSAHGISRLTNGMRGGREGGRKRTTGMSTGMPSKKSSARLASL